MVELLSQLRGQLRILRNYIRFYFRNEIAINGYFFYNEDYTLKHNNFGDDINFPILEALTGRPVKQQWLTGIPNISTLYCIGSIVESCDKNSIIWGAGAIEGIKPLVHKPKKVLAVRGPLTRDYLINQGISCPSVYGDPALLLPLIYNPNVEKKYEYGIIPHYIDYDLPHVKIFREKHPEVLFIKFEGYVNWKDVIDQILSCRKIVSSSLHGLIVSDAYRIPNVRVVFSNQIIGGDFKFKDYMAGVERDFVKPIDCRSNIPMELIETMVSDYKEINFNPSRLLSAFPYKIKRITNLKAKN